MEYMAMLEEPGLVSGLQELIHDTEPSVVKRTIRVFTNVYRHSLSLLATGDLDPVKYETCYAEINMVSNDLIDMLKAADNEGVVVHLVRYLEAALVSHILSDLSKHPHIALMTAPMLKKGVTALLDLVDTPYVGGTAFCVAIRALITVACYQVDMRPKITEVCEALINSPPPNLFDHNVRSFHKTLQRNLFRLLKRAEEDVEKERLIDLMVRVGVPRKRLVEWRPRPNKKRPASSTRETTRYDGKGILPVSKRVRLTEEQIIRLSPPVGTRSKIFSPPPSSSSSQKSPITIKPTSEEPAPASISSILDQILSGDKVSVLNWLPPVKKTERKSIDSILKEKSAATANRGALSTPSSTYNALNTIRGILKLPASSGVVPRTTGRISPEQQSKENSPNHSSGRISPLESETGFISPSHPSSISNSPKQTDALDTSASPATSVPSDRKPISPRPKSISPRPASGHNSPLHLSGRNSPNVARNSTKQIPLVREGGATATTSLAAAAAGLVTGADQSNTDEQTSIRNSIRQQGFTPRESLFFEKLTAERVVEMLLSSTMNVPAETPKYIPRINLEPLEIMKEKLAILLAIYVPDSSMSPKSEPKTVEVKKTKEDRVPVDSITVTASERISSEVTSMETDPLFFSKDFDLRQGMSNSSDIDMRSMPLSCDPRNANTSFSFSQSKDSDLRKQIELERHSKPASRDPRLAAQSTSDPRLSSNSRHGNPPVSGNDPRLHGNPPVSSSDPRLHGSPPISSSDSRLHGNPPASSSDPRLYGNPPVSSSDPRLHGNPPASSSDPRLHGNPPVSSSDPRRHGNPPVSGNDPRLHGSPPVSSNDPRLYGNPPVSNSDPRLTKATPVSVSSFPPLPPPPVALQSQPPLPPSRDPRLAARRSPPAPPMLNPYAAVPPAVSASYGHTAGIYLAPTTYTAPAAYTTPATYAAPASYSSPTTYPSPAPYPTLAPAPYGGSSSAPQLPSFRDPRLNAGPNGAQGATSFPVLPSYPIRQPPPNVYPNSYAGVSIINSAYSGGLY